MKRLSLFACVLIGVMTFTHSLQAITLEAASLGELSAESNIIGKDMSRRVIRTGMIHSGKFLPTPVLT